MTEAARTILLVEDEAVIALAERQSLERHGYIVVVAASGEEALRLASDLADMDLALVDVDLGEGADGRLVAEAIMAARNVPVLFLPGYTEREIAGRTEGQGVAALDASIEAAIELSEANRRREGELRRDGQLLKALMDNSLLHIYFKDRACRFTMATESTARMFGLPSAGEMVGKSDFDFFSPEHARQAFEDERQVMESGLPIRKEERETWQGRADTWVLTEKLPLRERDGTIAGTFGISTDITERKRAQEQVQALLEEKETLLKEVHHRIKNNLHAIKSLLDLQADSVEHREAASVLEDASRRIDTMVVLYDSLHGAQDFGSVSAGAYLSSLVDEVLATFPARSAVRVEKDIEDFDLDIKRLQALGMIVNELVTNCMKYAFVGKEGGTIAVVAHRVEEELHIVVRDDGVGLPTAGDLDRGAGFGLRLVASLAQQIGGRIELERDRGTAYTLKLRR